VTARNPREIREDLKTIGRLLKPLAEEYAWMHGFAFTPSSRHGYGEGGNSGKKGIGYSDSTGNVASDETKSRVRRAVEMNDEAVAEALRLLVAALRRQRKRFTYQAFDLMNLPDDGQQVSKAEVREAEEAKAKRMARGEGFGDG
jgi:hypothetical protein